MALAGEAKAKEPAKAKDLFFKAKAKTKAKA